MFTHQTALTGTLFTGKYKVVSWKEQWVIEEIGLVLLCFLRIKSWLNGSFSFLSGSALLDKRSATILTSSHMTVNLISLVVGFHYVWFSFLSVPLPDELRFPDSPLLNSHVLQMIPAASLCLWFAHLPRTFSLSSISPSWRVFWSAGVCFSAPSQWQDDMFLLKSGKASLHTVHHNFSGSFSCLFFPCYALAFWCKPSYAGLCRVCVIQLFFFSFSPQLE